MSETCCSPPPLRVAQMVDDSDGDDGVGGAGLEGEREAVRSHGEEAAVATDSHEVLAKVTADLKSKGQHFNYHSDFDGGIDPFPTWRQSPFLTPRYFPLPQPTSRTRAEAGRARRKAATRGQGECRVSLKWPAMLS